MYALKGNEVGISVTTTARRGGMLVALQMPDACFTIATTARKVGRIVLLSLIAFSGGACSLA